MVHYLRLICDFINKVFPVRYSELNLQYISAALKVVQLTFRNIDMIHKN